MLTPADETDFAIVVHGLALLSMYLKGVKKSHRYQMMIDFTISLLWENHQLSYCIQI